MSILTKVKKPKKPKQAADQQTDASTPKALTASKPTAPVSSPARASLSRASIDNPNEASKSMYTPQRPSNLRTSSSASVKPLPARPPMARTAASEPNLAARGRISRTSSDLSIDSVMMSRNQNPGPNGHMALQTRQADFKPTMYTYDPSKAPSLAGRKRQYRSCHSHPSTRASSFVRSPHISTMVEENEEVEENADSSSSSTRSNSSNSSTHSHDVSALLISDPKPLIPLTEYLEIVRTASDRVQQQEAAAPEIPPRNPARNSVTYRRTSIASSYEAKHDSVVDSSVAVTSAERNIPPPSSTTANRTESPGPKSKKRNWFSKKHTRDPIAAQ